MDLGENSKPGMEEKVEEQDRLLKGNVEELHHLLKLCKLFKSCEHEVAELWDTVQRSRFQMGIEGEECRSEGLENVLNKIRRNFPKLRQRYVHLGIRYLQRSK